MDFVTLGLDRAGAVDDNGFRDIKIAKNDLMKIKSSNLSESHHQHFSHPHFFSPTGFTRNSVVVVSGVFTPAQWMELEQQAMIYKYITANVPIPSFLLNPIRKAFQSAAYYSSLRFNTMGWGGFHLGSYCNADPEPGRCRRTDGKKWRCARDVVPDQKYCERHMNRGRRHSRKPVEGQSANPNSPDFGQVNDHKTRSLFWPNHRPTKLSISMSDFTSPKLAASTTQQLDMGLAVSTNWVLNSWELPMGGPLGEALHTPAETGKPLNLIDSVAALSSSPTGSPSNSSAGALMNPSLPAV